MDLLNATLGAVGQVGDAIDKYTGGRAVRGTLAGKPRELASIVPFSDSMGLTRPEDKTSGRDLTDSYGLTTKGSNSFGSHAAGFVADNVLSPANWLGAGAAFKAAPTLARGAVGAAKALTGADLLDHVAGGAKKLGSFLGGESGAVLMPGAGGYDDAIKAYEANKHLVAKKGPDGAFVDAIDAMKLPRNVEDTVYHIRNNMADFGKADVSGDERVGTDLWNRLQHAGEDFFGDESGALKIPSMQRIDEASNWAGDELARRLGQMHGGSDTMYVKGKGIIPSRDAVRPYLDFKRIDQTMTDPDSLPGLVDKIANAASDYTASGSGYRYINDSLRGTGRPGASVPGSVDGLKHLMSISRTPERLGNLFRGIDAEGIRHIEKILGVPLDSPEAVGRTFTDPGFLSSSMNKGVAKGFMDRERSGNPGVIMDLSGVPIGTKASLVHPGESEILFPPGRRIAIADNSQWPNVRGVINPSGVDPKTGIWGGLKKFLGDQSGALKIGRAPWTPQEIAHKTGITPSHMGFDEASTAYQSWVNSLSPEEQSAVKLFTSGPQAKISHTLRGASSSSGGHPLNPFDDSHSGSTIPGTPSIKTPHDVNQEVVPYLDSALSRGSTPKDAMTYRLSGQIGNLTADNASRMVGKTVSDPSYMSTTINPWGRFYGNNASPKDLLLDILAPQGSHGGYADALSSWEAEKELLLPRGSKFKVHGVHDVPVQKIDHEYYRLDPAGKPIPKPGHSGSGLFVDDASDKFYGNVAKQGSFGDTVVPDELMAPNWREIASQNLQGEGSQKNILLRMMSEGQLAPHEASVGRMTAQQMWGELMDRFNSPGARIPEGYPVARTLKDMAAYSKVGKYPDESYLRSLANYGGIRTDDILRSRPKTGGILDAMKNFGQDESGYLRHAIPGVDPELANAMDGLGPQYPGGVQKLRDIADQVSANPAGMDSEDLREVKYRLNKLINGHQGHGVSSEIPEGSKFLGAGAEGIVFRTPEGSAVRVGDVSQSPRPDLPEMLQAYREARYGPYSVEHMPLVNPAHNAFEEPMKRAGDRIWHMSDPEKASNATVDAHDAVYSNNKMNDISVDMADELRNGLAKQGHNPWDVTSWNIGLTPEGKAIVYDGGAIKGGSNRSFLPKPTYDTPRGDLLQRVMAQGGPEKVRESLRQGLAAGTQGQGVDMPQLAGLLDSRRSVQGFLKSLGVEAGPEIGSPRSPVFSPPAELEGSAPGMGKVLGTLGATAAGGGLLAYLLGGSQVNGNP